MAAEAGMRASAQHALNFANAVRFFGPCEEGKGFEAVSDLVAEGATFELNGE